jgi:cell division protein FtsZ
LSIEGARGVLFNVQGGKNLSLLEVSEAAEIIRQHADPEAKIIFGTSIDPNLQDEIRITVIATGFTKEKEEVPVFSGATGLGGVRETKMPYNLPKFGRDEPASQPSIPTRPAQNNNYVDDQLDIPAFLRKKIQSDDEN